MGQSSQKYLMKSLLELEIREGHENSIKCAELAVEKMNDELSATLRRLDGLLKALDDARSRASNQTYTLLPPYSPPTH